MSERKIFNNLEIAFASMSDKRLKKAHFIFSVINNRLISSLLTWLVRVSLLLRLPIQSLIRTTVFEHFCGGESINDSVKTISKLASFGVKTILDYSVEGEESDRDFDNTMEEILKIIAYASSDGNVPFSVFKMSGLGPVDVLTKASIGEKMNSSEQLAFNLMKDRVRRVCSMAHKSKLPIMVDAEETWIQGAIDIIVYEMMRDFNKDDLIVYNTYQMYRTDSLDLLSDALRMAEEQEFFLGAKLVRGAYMERERERAKEYNYPDPIHPDKDSTDNCFNQGLEFCVNHVNKISVMCGSHNELSNELLTSYMRKFSIKNDDSRLWFAQLYGMSNNISFNLAKRGYNVTKYVPYGPVGKVMPYLLRRAEENTSVSGQSSRELLLINMEMKRRRLLT